MLYKKLILATVLPLVLFGSWRVWAHHAFSAEFDKDAPVNLVGKITRIEWINPHAWIHLAAEQPDGSTVAWMVEGGTPNTLLRAGVNRNTLPIGSEIRVRGYQAKNKSCEPACKANGRDITLPDGSKALLFHHRMVAAGDGWQNQLRAPVELRTSALMSIVSWSLIVTCDRLIAYDWYDCAKDPAPIIALLAGCIDGQELF